MSFVDYYEVLQVSPLADRDVIEKAYRVLISKFHPDKDGDVHKAQQINEAWNSLRDADRRAVYNIEYGRRISLGSEREPRVESDEEAFWTKVRTRPAGTLSTLRHRFRELELRLRRLETVVTSPGFRLRREIDDLER